MEQEALSFDSRDEFAMWMIDQGFDAELVTRFARNAPPYGFIWWSKPPPDLFEKEDAAHFEAQYHWLRTAWAWFDNGQGKVG